MLMRMNQKGESRLGCIFGLIILAAAIFAAYKMIPVKIKAAEMRDAVEDNARSAGGKSNDTIEKILLQKGRSLGLPIEAANIEVNRRGDDIIVDVDYSVPVEFPGYTHVWHFHHHAENPVF